MKNHRFENSLFIAMIAALVVAAITIVTLVAGCQPATSTTQPSIFTGFVTIAERVALGYAQKNLNAAYIAGTVTRAQYDAAEGILVKLSDDLAAGTLTQAQVDDLVNKALADAALIYIPITPIGPIAPPAGGAAKAGMWTATPVAGWKRK